MENIKKKQMEIHIEAEDTVTKIKKASLNGFSSRIEMERKVSEFEDETIEIIQSERQNEILKKKEQCLMDL